MSREKLRSEPISRYLFIAAALQIVWGLVPSASKFVIDEIPIELYIALRWTISGGLFALYLTLTKKWKPLANRDLATIAGLGALGYGIASLGSLYGLKIGGVANFAMMAASGPIVLSSLSILILGERPKRSFFLALPLCVVGLVLLVDGKYEVSSLTIAIKSAACILAGAFLEALVFVYSKKFKARVAVAQYLATTQLAAAALMWTSQAFYFHQTSQLGQLSARGFISAIFVSVVACVLCYAVLYWLLNFVEGHRLALFDGFHALSATFFGWLLFSETLTARMLIGGALILAALIGGSLPQHAFSETPE